MRSSSLTILFLCASHFLSSRAFGIEVTTTADAGAGSLRQVIGSAALGASITFASGVTGTITLTSGQIVISRDLIIQGPGANTLKISGNNASRVFRVDAGNLTLSGLTIADGRVVGANGSAGNNAVSSGNGNSGGAGGGGGAIGGGMFVDAGASVFLIDAIFSNNTVLGGPGGAGGLSTAAGNGNGGSGGTGAVAKSGVAGVDGGVGCGPLGGIGGTGLAGGGGGGGGGCGAGANGGAGSYGGGGGGGGGGGSGTGGSGGDGGDSKTGIFGGRGGDADWDGAKAGGGGGGAGLGGGLFVWSGAKARLMNVSFVNNQASSGTPGAGSTAARRNNPADAFSLPLVRASSGLGKGAGVFGATNAVLEILNLTFSGNTAAAAGTTALNTSGTGGTDNPSVYGGNISLIPVTAVADSFSTGEDAPLSISAPGLLANDVSVGNPLSAVLVSSPAHGSATVQANGSFLYTPAANFFGEDSFTYKVTDSVTQAASSAVAVAIKVTPVPDPGVPTLSTVTPLPDGSKNVAYKLTFEQLAAAANASDPDGDPVYFLIHAVSSGYLGKDGALIMPGTTTLKPGESLLWLPPADQTGVINAFSIRAHDGLNPSATPVPVPIEVKDWGFPIRENFDGKTVAGLASWVVTPSTGGPAVTANALQLTTTAANKTGAAIYNVAFPSIQSLPLEFDFDYFGPTSAGTEGLSFFLLDGSVSTPAAGGDGGALGYAYSAATITIPGVTKAFMGVGFTRGGNFVNNASFHDGIANTNTPNQVALRGPATSSVSVKANKEYDYVLNSAKAFSVAPTSLTTPKVKLTLTPDGKITLLANTGANAATEAIYDGFDFINSAAYAGYPIPRTFKFGFAATTGAASGEAHNIDNIAVGPPADLAVAFTSAPSGSPAPGLNLSYEVTVTNNGPNGVSGAAFTYNVPSVLTGVTWSYTVSGDLASGNGTGNAIAVKLPLFSGASAKFTVTGTLLAAATVGSTLINTATITAGSGLLDSTTANNTASVTNKIGGVPTLSEIQELRTGYLNVGFSITHAALLRASEVTDPDKDPISFRVEAVSRGILTKNGAVVTPGTTLLKAGESWVWLPSPGQSGTISAFTVKASDGSGFSVESVPVRIVVAGSGLPLNENFDGKTAASLTSWTSSTNGSSVDSSGRLVIGANAIIGSAIYKTPFISSQGQTLQFDFDYTMAGAVRGLSFFLLNGSVAMPSGTVSGVGLGYAYSSTTPGIPMGYLGAGFDIAGSFATKSAAAFHDGVDAKIHANSIALRGPSTNNPSLKAKEEYDYVTGSWTNVTPAVSKAVRMTLKPDGTLTMLLSSDNRATWQTVYDNLNYAGTTAYNGVPTPSTFLLGFADTIATAKDTNFVALDNISVTLPTDLRVEFTSAPSGSVTSGSTVSWTLVVTNAGPNADSAAQFVFNVPSGIQNVAWNYTISGGLGSGNGTGNAIAATLPLLAGGSATFTITGTVGLAAEGRTLNFSSSIKASAVFGELISMNNTASANLVVPDTAPPSLVSITRLFPETQTTSDGSLTFGVFFSEAVKDVDTGDFTVTTTGSATGYVGAASYQDATSFYVTVHGVDGTGTVRLDLKSSGTGITDTAGNAITGGFTAGQTYTVAPAPARLLRDINREISTDKSEPGPLVNLNGTVYFFATDPVFGRELWKSDGTSAGTTRVKNINSSREIGGSPSTLVLVAAKDSVYFFMYDGAYRGLWKSDGTEAGTVVLKKGVNDWLPTSKEMVNVNGTLFFTAQDASGNELWKSDGTEAGTVRVKDIWSGGGSSSPAGLVNVNGTLFFSANDGSTGTELWKSDGTEAGTVLVKDIKTGAGGSNPAILVNLNGTLFFQANDGSNGSELWKSDGTAAGTVLVKDIKTGAGGSNPIFLVNVNGTLYFSADGGTTGTELWKSDGTPDGTLMVKDIRSSGGSSPMTLANVNGTLLFTADDGTSGRQLWKSDGTDAGTVLVKVISKIVSATGVIGSEPANLVDVNGTLFFGCVVQFVGENERREGIKTPTAGGRELRLRSRPPAQFNSLTNLLDWPGRMSCLSRETGRTRKSEATRKAKVVG